MLSKLIGIVLGCGLAAALAASGMACEFNRTSAKNDQAQASQQTAESQPSGDVTTQ